MFYGNNDTADLLLISFCPALTITGMHSLHLPAGKDPGLPAILGVWVDGEWALVGVGVGTTARRPPARPQACVCLRHRYIRVQQSLCVYHTDI